MEAMQIRISDMLDNASELIEENREVRNTTNNDRIKKIVFSEIDCTSRHIVKEKEKRNMRKRIFKIMKWAGLILLGVIVPNQLTRHQFEICLTYPNILQNF